MRRTVFILVCLLFSTFPATAEKWEEALAAFDAERYEDVLNLLAPMAKPDNVAAQLLLFDAYMRGRSTKVDQDAWLDWTRRGAKLGIAPAQADLAENYLHGIGLEAADEARAVHWFTLAADQWYAPAVYNLAVLTMNGQGTAANPDHAVGLLLRAAEFNEPYALYVLGGLYLEGHYVERNLDSGLSYLSQAAFFGQRRAMALLGIVIQQKPGDPDVLMKSAFHFRRALAAGCTDIGDLADQALDRLSPGEVEALEYNLAAWEPDMAPYHMDLPPGPCLSQ